MEPIFIAMKDICGFRISDKKRFSGWQPLLESWIETHREFVRRADDAGYWYTERSNVGLLAAAAWRVGLIALEEYQVHKVPGSPEKRKQKDYSKGRCDLWLHGSRVTEVIEAKMRWVALQSKVPATLARTSLKSAVSDATRTVGEDRVNSSGVSFIVPYVPVAGLTGRSLEAGIEEFVEALRSESTGAIAWFFCSRTREYCGEKGRNRIPGVVLMVESATKK